ASPALAGGSGRSIWARIAHLSRTECEGKSTCPLSETIQGGAGCANWNLRGEIGGNDCRRAGYHKVRGRVSTAGCNLSTRTAGVYDGGHSGARVADATTIAVPNARGAVSEGDLPGCRLGI